MTVKECYDAIGADYDDVFSRLRKDDRIRKFCLRCWMTRAMSCC